ncbi:MAG: TetR/AcrR family transcriptional regulator [Polaribacter sp.]
MLKTSFSQLTPDTLKLFSDKTRDTILESSLIMFNERGFNSVTTSSIADTTGILEGSLWYHFNTKKDILSAHIQLLEQVFLNNNRNVDSERFDTIIHDIFKSYNLIWDFRYILRDNFQNLLKDDQIVMDLVTQINNNIDAWVEDRIQHSNDVGLLKIPQEEVENISEVILVLGRYWLDFSEKKYTDVENKSLRLKGLNHIFLVLKPYINQEATPMIEYMLNQ